MIGKLTCGILLFLGGLCVGMLWKPLNNNTAPNNLASNNKIDKLSAAARKEFGEETGRFVDQFKDLSIRIKQYPFNANASSDGRFVIRLGDRDDTIASELIYPGGNKIPDELVRHYSFSCNGKTFSCDFGRSLDGSTLTNVQFHFEDETGHELSYTDSNADGYWDRYTDISRPSPPKFYRTNGLSWEEYSTEDISNHDGINEPKTENVGSQKDGAPENEDLK